MQLPTDFDKTDFVKKLKQARKKQQLTKKQLAQLINVSERTYSSYENIKDNRLPRIDTARLMSTILHISLEQLILKQDNITLDDTEKELQRSLEKRIASDPMFGLYLRWVVHYSDARIKNLLDAQLLDITEGSTPSTK